MDSDVKEPLAWISRLYRFRGLTLIGDEESEEHTVLRIGLRRDGCTSRRCPVPGSKLILSASLYALDNGALVGYRERSCRIGWGFRGMSTASFGRGCSRAARCPESSVTCGLKLIEVLLILKEFSEAGTRLPAFA